MPKRKKKMNMENVKDRLGVDLKDVPDESVKSENPESANSEDEKSSQNLMDEIKKAIEGLYYISETDAEITAFAGDKTDSLTKENLLNQIKREPDTPVEERDFTEFFDKLTEIQDWYGDEEKETAAKFGALRDLLRENLQDLKVFKVGQIELDVYTVGLDSQRVLTGIQTKAVET